jgi:ankyrin repeat protein
MTDNEKIYLYEPDSHAKCKKPLTEDAISEFLKKQKQNINDKYCDGYTLLHIATTFGQLDIIEKLLEQKEVEIETKDTSGRTALTIAAQYGLPDNTTVLPTVKILLAHGADIDVRGHNGKTILMDAVLKKDYDLVSFLIDEKKIKIDEIDDSGRTALVIAAENADIKMVELLLRKGADPNVSDKYGDTAISVADKQVKHFNDFKSSNAENNRDIDDRYRKGLKYTELIRIYTAIVKKLLQTPTVRINKQFQGDIYKDDAELINLIDVRKTAIAASESINPYGKSINPYGSIMSIFKKGKTGKQGGKKSKKQQSKKQQSKKQKKQQGGKKSKKQQSKKQKKTHKKQHKQN